MISNTIKYIRDPLYLLWRSKDLIRLVSWRLHKHLAALTAAPTIFEGKYLDQVAKKTSSRWPTGNYTASGFRRLVAELGIVGRVRKQDEKTGIITADFEYNMHDRLTLNSDDLCVIHPMFYYKLQVRKDEKWIIYPFPDHEDYEEM